MTIRERAGEDQNSQALPSLRLRLPLCITLGFQNRGQ